MNEENEITEHMKSYQDKAFKGPNSIVSSRNGTLYFTDSGPLGETTINSPTGSVFSLIGEFIQPLAFRCLAHPSGIALSPKEDEIYVCETLKNRILRFVRRPSGIYQCSVFHQFNGLLGPTSIAVDGNGYLYVSRFEFSDIAKNENGVITVLTPEGEKAYDIKVKGSELTHICFDSEMKHLYFSEVSSKTIYKIMNETR
jgi:sugar lactone lactonase YvrE